MRPSTLPSPDPGAPGEDAEHASAVDYRRLFRALPGLHLRLSPEWVILDASDAYLDATMTRREEIAGRSLFEVFARSQEIGRANQTLREENAQLEKLQTLGRSTAAIAHDFNNLLGVITGFTEMLGEAVAADERSAGFVREIAGAARRAARLTEKLLACGRSAPDARRVVEIRRTLGDMRGLLERLLGERHPLQFEFSGEGLAVRADPGQLEQIIMNLALNARDAMPGGGRVVISAQPAAVRPPGTPEGAAVAIEVRDEGAGMDDATKARIFDPFFTTKGVAGAGIGLTAVQDLVASNRGTIRVESAPGRGSRFTVVLPRAESREDGEERDEPPR